MQRLGRGHPEVQQARQRQVDVGDLVERQPVVERPHALELVEPATTSASPPAGRPTPPGRRCGTPPRPRSVTAGTVAAPMGAARTGGPTLARPWTSPPSIRTTRRPRCRPPAPRVLAFLAILVGGLLRRPDRLRLHRRVLRGRLRHPRRRHGRARRRPGRRGRRRGRRARAAGHGRVEQRPEARPSASSRGFDGPKQSRVARSPRPRCAAGAAARLRTRSGEAERGGRPRRGRPPPARPASAARCSRMAATSPGREPERDSWQATPPPSPEHGTDVDPRVGLERAGQQQQLDLVGRPRRRVSRAGWPPARGCRARPSRAARWSRWFT